MYGDKTACVYILASGRNGTLYVGVTSQLVQRIYQHREELGRGFTQRYQVKQLVYYEVHETMPAAITREKQLKKWRREWKLALIEDFNPRWDDLYNDMAFAGKTGMYIFWLVIIS